MEVERGLMDYVIVAELVRSPMGVFQSLYESGEIRWNTPKEADIAGCTVAAIAPFFADATQMAAELCVKYQKPYVTIDCPHTEYLHRHAAVNVISKECLADERYRLLSREEVLAKMTNETDGLVIITSGAQDMLFGRKGEPVHRMTPFSVDVRSTLGAGDTFKAGCVYGLMKGLSDEELVRFASACSAVAISRYPLPLYPPTLAEVEALLNGSR